MTADERRRLKEAVDRRRRELEKPVKLASYWKANQRAKAKQREGSA